MISHKLKVEIMRMILYFAFTINYGIGYMLRRITIGLHEVNFLKLEYIIKTKTKLNPQSVIEGWFRVTKFYL
jgi:hypothetical protein